MQRQAKVPGAAMAVAGLFCVRDGAVLGRVVRRLPCSLALEHKQDAAMNRSAPCSARGGGAATPFVTLRDDP